MTVRAKKSRHSAESLRARVDAIRQEDPPQIVYSVPDMLEQCAATYRERNATYGASYKQFGKVLREMFPEGLNLKTEDDWNRIGVFVQIMTKCIRYGNNFKKGGHEDSLVDNTVYSQMLRELDAEIRARGE